MKNSEILVTGATGFLGSNLIKALVTNGYNISILKRSFSSLARIQDVLDQITAYNIDEVSLDDILGKVQPQVIIHCATDYGRKNSSRSDIIDTNLILPLKILELCQKNQVPCFINTDTYLDKGTNYYSLSKKQFKDWLDTYSTELVCVNVILEHFFGPSDDKTKFVSNIIEQLLSNNPEINLTPGKQKRDFIFIDDVVSAFLYVIKNSLNKNPGLYQYEIGTNNEIEIKELVEMIRDITGNKITKLNFGALPYRPNELMKSKVDTAAIKALGWEPKYSLKEGIKKTINFEREKRH
jgi:CDP-paratose synthetase